MRKILENITFIIVGILVALFGMYAYWFYSMNKTANEDHVLLSQVVNYLNQQIQAKAPASAPVVSTPTPTK